MEDFVRRFHRGAWSDKRELQLSRWLTVFWGAVTLTLSFFVGDIAPTVLEAINKIGSLANGPILAVFVLGFFVRRVQGWLTIPGLLAGMLFNGWCWVALPELSWLWWNPLGFVVAFVIPVALSTVVNTEPRPVNEQLEVDASGHAWLTRESRLSWRARSAWLLGWFLLLWLALALI